MGNCLTGSKVVVEEIERCKASHVNGGKMKNKNNNKKVSFDLGEEEGARRGDSREGVVRIRVVLTQKELKQLLSFGKDSEYSSAEGLLRTMKKRSRKVSDGEIDRSWRPALETIPEDRY